MGNHASSNDNIEENIPFDLPVFGLPDNIVSTGARRTRVPSEYFFEDKKSSVLSLTLTNCGIKRLNFSKLKKPNLILTKLHLSRNLIRSIPSDFRVFVNLTDLSLKHNRLDVFPIEICALCMLKKLSLAGNQIREVPSEISQLKQLESLSLASNMIWILPTSIDQLSNLKVLNLERNILMALPSFSELTLEVLTVHRNRLQTLPSLSNCLHVLNFSFNNFNEVPEFIGELRELRELSFSVNNISVFPFGILGNLSKLVELNVHSNRLTCLPQDLESCVLLRRLNVAINRLEEFPESILKLVELEWLNMNDNRIAKIPPGIISLKQLSKLGMVQNCVTEIPYEIACLPNLRKVDLSRNAITVLPSVLLFTDDTTIVLNNNPFATEQKIISETVKLPSLFELTAQITLKMHLTDLYANLSAGSSGATTNSVSSLIDEVYVFSSPDVPKIQEKVKTFHSQLIKKILPAIKKPSIDDLKAKVVMKRKRERLWKTTPYNELTNQATTILDDLRIPRSIQRRISKPKLCHCCLTPIIGTPIQYIDHRISNLKVDAKTSPFLFEFCTMNCYNDYRKQKLENLFIGKCNWERLSKTEQEKYVQQSDICYTLKNEHRVGYKFYDLYANRSSIFKSGDDLNFDIEATAFQMMMRENNYVRVRDDNFFREMNTEI